MSNYRPADRRPGSRQPRSHPQQPDQQEKVEFRLRAADGSVPGELYDAVAEKIAGSLVRGRNGVSRHQLRRLFDETKRIRRRLDSSSSDPGRLWAETLPLIKLLKSKVAYMAARAEKKDRDDKPYYVALREFVAAGVDQVQKAEDFARFVTLFEAVYGFYYALGGNNVGEGRR